MSSLPEKKKKGLSSSRRATVVAALVALVLVVIKVTIGLLSGSIALIASAVDSGLDALVSLFNNFAIHNAEKPSDEEFNYGRGKVEGLAALLEGVMIGLSSIFILGAAVMKMISGQLDIHTQPAIWVMAVSALITGLLVIYLQKVLKKTGDLVIKADALHYKVDLYTNLGILAALAIISQTGFGLLDPLVSIAIAVYIFSAAYKLVKEGVHMLLDRALDPSLTEKIADILNRAERVSSYHLLRTRQSANVYFVDVHLVFTKTISLWDAHVASEKVEEEISELVGNKKWVINCHLDPEDDLVEDILSAGGMVP